MSPGYFFVSDKVGGGHPQASGGRLSAAGGGKGERERERFRGESGTELLGFTATSSSCKDRNRDVARQRYCIELYSSSSATAHLECDVKRLRTWDGQQEELCEPTPQGNKETSCKWLAHVGGGF